MVLGFVQSGDLTQEELDALRAILEAKEAQDADPRKPL